MIYNKFLGKEDGASAIEYGLLAGLIAVVIILAVTDVGEALLGIFERIAEDLSNVGG